MATKMKKVDKNDRIDLDMTMGLIGNALLSDNGLQQLQTMHGAAKDPAAVLGQMAYHAIGTTRDKLAEKGLNVSPKIWVARGGVVDQTIAEAAKAIAGIGGDTSILNRNVLEGARSQVLDAMHQEETHGGGAGDPSRVQDDGDADEESDYEGTPQEEAADNEYQSIMPGAEAGGDHGPDRMPAPTGLLGGA